MDIDDQELSFSEKLLLTDIGDLGEMCKSKCATKYLSTLLHMSLRSFNIKWEDVDEMVQYKLLIGISNTEKTKINEKV